MPGSKTDKIILLMKKTLAIYAIPDVNPDYPEFIHDHNLAIYSGNRPEKYLHFERLTGKKYDNTLHRSLYGLLKQAKLLGEDFDLAFVDSVVGRSFISEEGKLRFEANPFAGLELIGEKGVSYWLDTQKPAYAVRHELAHIFSTVPFYGMFKENSLLVHFDGGASVGNFSVWHWKGGGLKLLDYGWKLKYLSSLFNANALNFFMLGVKRREHNSLPGKFMGFAGWGKYDRRIEQWLRENDFFADIWSEKKRFFDEAEKAFGWNKRRFDTRDKFLQDIAATVQHFFTRETVRFFADLQKLTGTKILYYSGGSALNLYVNDRLVEMFDEVFIPPATNDAGLSLGAGAYVGWLKGYETERQLPYLNNWGLNCPQVIDRGDDIPRIARLLLDGKILGICNGWGEAGPRALGNRSIIALPGSKELARRVSEQKKGREWYRPVAPVMLADVAREVTGRAELPLISKFMLVSFKILPQFYGKLKGVVHADGTARIQVLFERTDNPFLWDLLKYLYENYKIPGLINTSFNAKGKPIVHFEDQAVEQARQMQLDALIINGKLYEEF